MEVYAKDRSDALQALLQSVQKGQVKMIRESLESLLTLTALEFDPEQVETIKNFVNTMKFDKEVFLDRTGGQEFRFSITDYSYQLD